MGVLLFFPRALLCFLLVLTKEPCRTIGMDGNEKNIMERTQEILIKKSENLRKKREKILLTIVVPLGGEDLGRSRWDSVESGE